MQLSVLDLSPVASGRTPADALRETIALAQHTESLGYARYWVAEHHNAGSLASAAPEIMIAQIAAATRTIRVGAGGIMLPNHSALKVAEWFRLLSTLYPGRIDLGLGRAAGTDPRTALALRRGPNVDDFPEQFAELRAYLADDDRPRDAFARTVRAIPIGAAAPEVWMLGSSDYGARFAAERRLPYAFAHHINPIDAVRALRDYRARGGGRSMLALSIICVEREEEAREQRLCAELSMLQFARGLRDLPLPSVAEARAYEWHDEDRALAGAMGDRVIVGTVPEVRARVLPLLDACAVDELMIMTHVHDPATRRRSYALLVEALSGGAS